MTRTQAVRAPARAPEHQPLRLVTRCERCGARAHNVCGALALVDLESLAAIAVTLDVPAGKDFISEDEPAQHFFNVTSGTVKLFKTMPDGRRQITGFVGAGHFLGLAVSKTYAFSAQALDGVRVCRYARPKLKALLVAFPAMEARLLEVASNELVAAQEQMLLLGRKSARERLASFLVGRMVVPPECVGDVATRARTIVLPMTRNDIADYLGITIETVSRTLTWLKHQEIIAISQPWHVTIRNHVALEALATGVN
jgi:CRP/FNR family transcriptional regulator